MGAETGAVPADSGALALVADHAIADVTEPEIVVVPGGPGSSAVAKDEAVRDWLRGAHRRSRWTTSVCTVRSCSAPPASSTAGERRLTGARSISLRSMARPTSERVVEADGIVTAAGMSAGIDMALQLAQRIAGEDVARAIQLHHRMQ